MKNTSALLHIYWMIAAMLWGCSSTSDSDNAQQILSKLQLPEGFSAEIYADNIPNARQMVLGNDRVVYVGSRQEGKIYALVDEDSNYKADTVYTIAEDLRMPSGVAYRSGSLYVAAVNEILRFDNIDEQLQDSPDPDLITDEYPTDNHHGWKYIAFGPDDKLYIPVGAPCNICNPEEDIFATITRTNPDGSDREIIARGVRNSVGFDWHPETDELWFTDNGRDWMGDNQPPCELNHLSEVGQHFGYPYIHGSDIRDPEFGEQGQQMDQSFRSPVQELDPHVAPLGMIFYTGDMFPEKYQDQILVAEHGSWNRSNKIGYRITMVSLQNNEATSYDTFVEGWLQENDAVWGRPVDLLQLQDGSILISDDHSGIIYRITYNNE